MQATLGHLVTVRAQRTVALLTYLRALVDLPDQNAPTFVGALRVTDSYIPPDVWKVPGTGERAPPGPGVTGTQLHFRLSYRMHPDAMATSRSGWPGSGSGDFSNAFSS